MKKHALRSIFNNDHALAIQFSIVKAFTLNVLVNIVNGQGIQCRQSILFII